MVLQKGVKDMSGGLKTWKRDFRHCWQMWILLLPALIWLVVFCYTPMYGLLIAFKDYKANLGIFYLENQSKKRIKLAIYDY